MTKKLEKRVEKELEKLGVGGAERGNLDYYMDLIKEHDSWTYNHCLRVGLKYAKMSEHLGLDEKLSLYTGLLHDIGKIEIPIGLLRKRKGFNEEDYKVMKEHPIRGYHLLKQDFYMTALIVAWHHHHQNNRYPKHPPTDHRMSRKTQEMVKEYSKILAIADFYDSVKTRKDDAFSVKPKIPGPRKRKKELLKAYPNQEELIKEFYKAKIFR